MFHPHKVALTDLEPDHTAPGGGWAGLHLLGGPPQRCNAVHEGEHRREPPREGYIYGEVPVSNVFDLVDVDHDARAPTSDGVEEVEW